MKKTIILSMALFAFTSIFAQDNLLKVNPNFETGKLNGWECFGPDKDLITVLPEAAYKSNFGLQYNVAETKAVLFSKVRDGVVLKIEKGKKYGFEMMVKVISKGSSVAFLSVYPVTGLKADGPNIQKKVPLKSMKENEWVKVNFDFDGVDMPEAKISLLINNGVYYLDDFKFYEVK
jgi:hypothetical protein